jgi:hypothetical protein
MSISRLAIGVFVSAAYVCAAPIVFNFDSDTVLTTTSTFTNTVNGLSATFSSTDDPGGFAVLPILFTTLDPGDVPGAGNVLIDGLSISDSSIPLTIAFATPIESVSLLFATVVAAPVQLQAYNGASLVGTVTASGTVQASGFAEGSISFSDPFNKVVLSSTAPAFAINDVTATAVPNVVPEPSSLFLVGYGLALSVFMRRWLGSKSASRK